MFRALFVVAAIATAPVHHADGGGETDTAPSPLRIPRQLPTAGRDPKEFSNCGRLFRPDTGNNGGKTYGSAPWNVGIYRKDDASAYTMICGGTLIAPNLVVTAAQFFWQKGLKDKTIRDNSEYYKIAVGKYTRDISEIDNGFTQIVDVRQIHLEDGFQDADGYYGNDIAIVVLKNSVVTSDAVMPVCVDWNKKFTIPNGSVGKIVGWGMTKNMTPSPVLLELFLSYFNRATCKDLNSNDQNVQRYITGDKFCGPTGETFRGGEAGLGGAGLTFVQNDLHFLNGILSIRYKGRYELLTDVSQHIPWIRYIVLKNTDTNCGRSFTPKENSDKTYGSTPWNVGIYRKTNNTQEYVMICGGTLIAPNLVVTAAQFFWQKGLKDKTVRDNSQYYKIAVGKYTRDVTEIDNESTQIVDVKFIYMENNYEDTDGYYANDIAIIVLNNNVITSDAVMPVCVDWTKKNTIPNGSVGKIAGWGMTKQMTPSDVLLELSLPYINRTTCQNLYSSSNKIQSYITSDKCCGLIGEGFRGGEAGFGGAGLTFSYNNLYFLTGVMSIKLKGKIELLTDVSKHISWIYDIYSNYNELGRFCPLYTSARSDIRCSLNGVGIDCSKPLISGTKLIQSCKTRNSNPNEIVCLPDGEWSGQLLNCASIPTSSSSGSSNYTPKSPLQQTRTTCIIPFSEGSIYSYVNETKLLYPGNQVEELKLVEENCRDGYYKTNEKRHLICGGNGQWLLYIPEPLCLKKCPAMHSDSLNLKCTYNGRKVNCSDLSINGTVLVPRCKTTHVLPNRQFETPMQSVCLPDGNWSHQLYSCVLNCGKKISKSISLIYYGVESKFGSVPWNAGVYEKKNGVYALKCGGTLISPNLIVSAATCFSKNGSTHYISVQDKSYKVAVGKYSSDMWKRDNEFTQIIDVSQIYMEDDYFGISGRYSNDIAVLVLSNNISTSHFVLPVCIDWNADYFVPDGSNGTIVGWGKTETLKRSPILMEASLPYISRNKCKILYEHNEDFKIFLTLDKFCAGSESGQSTSIGDTGYGLTFEHDGSHYLTGISSLKDGSEKSYSLFTNVGHHIKWINTIYQANTNAQNLRVPAPRK